MITKSFLEDNESNWNDGVNRDALSYENLDTLKFRLKLCK